MSEDTSNTTTETTPAAAPEPTQWSPTTLPDPLKNLSVFQGEKTIEQIAADIDGAMKSLGTSIRIPGPDASPEQRKEFLKKAVERMPELMPIPDPEGENYDTVFQRLGKPEAPEKYLTPEIEGFQLPPETLGAMKAQAHSNNLTQKQFENNIRQMAEQQRVANETFQRAKEEDTALLKAEWGAAYGDRMEVVKGFLNSDANVPEDFKEAFNSGKLNSASVKWLHNLAEMAYEGNETTTQQGTGSSTGNLTPMEAKARAEEIFLRLREMQPTDPQYQALIQKRLDYIRMAGIK